MKPFRWILLLAFLLPLSVHGQVAWYGEFSAAVNGGTYLGVTSMYGASIGGYFDGGHLGPLSPGLDVRGVLLHTHGGYSGSNYNINTFLAGPRVALRTPKWRIRPYAEFLIGSASIKFPDNFSIQSSHTFLTF